MTDAKKSKQANRFGGAGIVSLTEAARLLKVSQNTIKGWAFAGCPMETGDKFTEWKINLGAVMDWRIERALAAATGDTDATLNEAKRRRAAALAGLAELDLMQRRGAVMPIAVIGQSLSDTILRARARLLVMPTKVAPQLMGLTNPVEAQNIVRDALYQALEDIARHDPEKRTVIRDGRIVQIDEPSNWEMLLSLRPCDTCGKLASDRYTEPVTAAAETAESTP